MIFFLTVFNFILIAILYFLGFKFYKNLKSKLIKEFEFRIKNLNTNINKSFETVINMGNNIKFEIEEENKKNFKKQKEEILKEVKISK